MTDVEIFAACLRELLMANDTVTVPGLGCFMTQLMPASFSDRGRTINPPYRKLSFRAVEQGDASMFLEAVASRLPQDQDAARWLASFAEGLKADLDKNKRVELPSLGAMRATEQNDYFFVASEELDIYPEGMGLEPVKIKSGSAWEEEIQEDLAPGRDAEPAIELIDETEPASGNAPAPETPPAPETSPAPETPPSAPSQAVEPRRTLKWWAILLIVAVVLLLLMILLIVFKDNLPWGDAIDRCIDRLLYSEEELRLLNH